MMEIKIKNNLLLSGIRKAGFKSVAEFCRTVDCQQGTVYEFLNLKRKPFGKRGQLNPTAERICDYLGKEVIELFPKEQLGNVLKQNKFEVELTSPQLQQLFCHEEIDPDKLIDYKHLKTKIWEILDVFETDNPYSVRMKEILIQRFGLDGNEAKTLKQVGDNLGIRQERVRQIEAKALRILRHPSQTKHLKPFLDDDFDLIATKTSAVLPKDNNIVLYGYCLSCAHNKFYKKSYDEFEMLYKCKLNLYCDCISSAVPESEEDAKKCCLNFTFKDTY